MNRWPTWLCVSKQDRRSFSCTSALTCTRSPVAGPTLQPCNEEALRPSDPKDFPPAWLLRGDQRQTPRPTGTLGPRALRELFRGGSPSGSRPHFFDNVFFKLRIKRLSLWIDFTGQPPFYLGVSKNELYPTLTMNLK